MDPVAVLVATSIASLLSAAVGAAIGAAGSYLVLRKERKTLAKGAARLVWAEMAMNQSLCATLADDASLDPPHMLLRNVWEAEGPRLATYLPDTTFTQLMNIYAVWYLYDAQIRARKETGEWGDQTGMSIAAQEFRAGQFAIARIDDAPWMHYESEEPDA